NWAGEGRFSFVTATQTPINMHGPATANTGFDRHHRRRFGDRPAGGRNPDSSTSHASIARDTPRRSEASFRQSAQRSRCSAATDARATSSSPSRYAINSSRSIGWPVLSIGRLLSRGFEILSQRHPRTEQPRPHRVHRNLEQRRDLVVTELLVFAQHQQV